MGRIVGKVDKHGCEELVSHGGRARGLRTPMYLFEVTVEVLNSTFQRLAG